MTEGSRMVHLTWAVDRWRAEVKNRPLNNVYRRALDTTWRQVITHFGGDPNELVGPDHQTLFEQAVSEMKGNKPDILPWHPIEELRDKYQAELFLQAPELVDLDCNTEGYGMGYWQDGAGDSPHSKEVGGCFLAGKWSMTNDEWYEIEVHPTHFIVLGPLGA